MNELTTLELDDQELMGVVGGGCEPQHCYKPSCEPCFDVRVDIRIDICLL